MGDTKLRKLEFQRALPKRRHKAHKTNNIHNIANEFMMQHQLDCNDARIIGDNKIGQVVLNEVSTVQIKNGRDEKPPVEFVRIT